MFFDFLEIDILRLMTVVKVLGIILSALSNSIILTILQFPKCAKFGSYRYLMMYYTIIDMVYSVSYYVSDMSAHSTNTSYVLFRHFRGSNRVLGAISLMQFCVMYLVVLCVLAVHFIYRYVALYAKPKLSKYFSTFKLFIWVSSCILFSVIVGGYKGYMFFENPYTTNKLRDEFAKWYNLSMDEIVYNGPVYWLCDEDDKTCYTPMKTVFGMGSIIFLLFLCFTTMTFFGVKSYTELRRHREHLSERTKSIQQQLMYALLIQSVIPIFFMYIPITLLFLSPAFGYGFGIYGNISMMSIAIYPPIDQFAIIYVIRDFRETVKNTISRMSIMKESSMSPNKKELAYVFTTRIIPTSKTTH